MLGLITKFQTSLHSLKREFTDDEPPRLSHPGRVGAGRRLWHLRHRCLLAQPCAQNVIGS